MINNLTRILTKPFKKMFEFLHIRHGAFATKKYIKTYVYITRKGIKDPLVPLIELRLLSSRKPKIPILKTYFGGKQSNHWKRIILSNISLTRKETTRLFIN